jgi:hypothetical protein
MTETERHPVDYLIQAIKEEGYLPEGILKETMFGNSDAELRYRVCCIGRFLAEELASMLGELEWSNGRDVSAAINKAQTLVKQMQYILDEAQKRAALSEAANLWTMVLERLRDNFPGGDFKNLEFLKDAYKKDTSGNVCKLTTEEIDNLNKTETIDDDFTF